MKQISKATIAISLALALSLTACQGPQTQAERSAREAAVARATKGRALFEEKCRTVAGIKIHRKVSDVDGILLLRVRPKRGDRELADQTWPGAAFARESTGDEYIATFLGFEYAPGNGLTGQPGTITDQERGYISTDRRPGGRRGFRFADVLDPKDGVRYRFTGRWQEPWQTDHSYLKGYIKFYLDKQPANEPAPRYGVTFEDYVVPEERALGLASSTVKVLDLQTHEVLGEYIRYAWSTSAPTSSNPVPWLTAYRCPDESVGTNAATRKFVDRVVAPRQENDHE